ncbi:MAG: hypothetical protein D6790_21815, partial [Caldilineae bacterium]
GLGLPAPSQLHGTDLESGAPLPLEAQGAEFRFALELNPRQTRIVQLTQTAGAWLYLPHVQNTSHERGDRH